jgi:hypothetical protein
MPYTFRVLFYDNDNNLAIPESLPNWAIEGISGTITACGITATFTPYELGEGKVKAKLGNMETYIKIYVYQQVHSPNIKITSKDKIAGLCN